MVVLGETKVHVAQTLSPAVARRWFLRQSKNKGWHVNNKSYKLRKWEYLKSRLVWTCEDESKKKRSEKPLYIGPLLCYHSHKVICSMINPGICTGGCWTVISKLMVGQYFLSQKSTCSLLASSLSTSSSWRSSRRQTVQSPSASTPSSPKDSCCLHSPAVEKSLVKVTLPELLESTWSSKYWQDSLSTTAQSKGSHVKAAWWRSLWGMDEAADRKYF